MTNISQPKVNIAIAGGPCTGKSTLAASLFASLKNRGFDYDLITEENRKLKKEFGDYKSPFERFYMWRQQEREELRSVASCGFITDNPLFQLYVSARMYAAEPRDRLAVRELFRMCLELEDRYQLIVIAKDPQEIQYQTDNVRSAGNESRIRKHSLTKSFVEHFWPEKLYFVNGSLENRVNHIEEKLRQMGSI